MSKGRSKYLLLIASVGVLIFSLVLKYGKGSPAEVPAELEVSNTPALTNILINDKAHDIGKVPAADEASTEFVIHNTGSTDLYIDRVEVSCTCTSGDVTQDAISPGDSVKVKVTYNKTIEGYFFQDVLVYGNFESSPEILSFEGFRTK